MSGTREYVCPECGYDGFTMSNVRSTFSDINVQVGCPRCATVDGRTVMLAETTDPRSHGLPASGSHD